MTRNVLLVDWLRDSLALIDFPRPPPSIRASGLRLVMLQMTEASINVLFPDFVLVNEEDFLSVISVPAISSVEIESAISV